MECVWTPPALLVSFLALPGFVATQYYVKSRKNIIDLKLICLSIIKHLKNKKGRKKEAQKKILQHKYVIQTYLMFFTISIWNYTK